MFHRTHIRSCRERIRTHVEESFQRGFGRRGDPILEYGLIIALALGGGRQHRSFPCTHGRRFHYVPHFLLLERVPGRS